MLNDARGSTEQLACACDVGGAIAAGEQAVVADAVEGINGTEAVDFVDLARLGDDAEYRLGARSPPVAQIWPRTAKPRKTPGRGRRGG